MEKINEKTQAVVTATTPQCMTSIEIAEVAGKQHKDVMRAIRNMEPAWVKACGRNFALTSRTTAALRLGVEINAFAPAGRYTYKQRTQGDALG